VQHALLKHTSPLLHRQSPEQFAQFSPVWQTPLPHTSASEHLPLVPHTYPLVQPGAHCPPHASSPHSLFAHCGVQQLPATVHFWPFVQPQSAGQLLQFSVGSHAPLPHDPSD
jgi:hypothetical protein